MFKVNKKDSRTTGKCRSSDFIVDFEHISQLFHVFLHVDFEHALCFLSYLKSEPHISYKTVSCEKMCFSYKKAPSWILDKVLNTPLNFTVGVFRAIF